MNKCKQVVFLLIIFNLSSCGAQNYEDYIVKSKKASNLILKNEQGSSLLFSVSDSLYIVVSKKESYFLEKIWELKKGKLPIKLSEKRIEKPNEVLADGFNINNYHEGLISFESDFYKNGYELASGSKTYFVMTDEFGKKHGEIVLSIIVKPNPIKEELYGYLASKLINYRKDN